jgi:hypothetical protein
MRQSVQAATRRRQSPGLDTAVEQHHGEAELRCFGSRGAGQNQIVRAEHVVATAMGLHLKQTVSTQISEGQAGAMGWPSIAVLLPRRLRFAYGEIIC